MSTLEAHAPVPLSPPGRSKRILVNVFIIHVLAVALPLGWVLLMAQFTDREETLSINIVDDPSVGPVTGPITMRRAPSDNPGPEPAPPAPAPPAPAPPAPEPVVDLPAVPQPKAVAEPVVDLPSPRPASKPEPKISLPKPPSPPAPTAPPNKNASKNSSALPDDRRLSNSKKGGGSNRNEDVPIGKEDVAQKFGEKFSNTAQGGPDKMSQYAAKLTMFLKVRWQLFVPSRADLGSSRPKVQIMLSISASGQVLEAKVVRPSGVAAMDLAAARFLTDLKQVPLPPDSKPWRHDNIELDTEM